MQSKNEKCRSRRYCHDSNCFTPLPDGDVSAIYTDSAYASEKHAKCLKTHKVENRIIKRAYRRKPLTEQDKQFNRLHSGTRCTVEQVFGVLKLHYDMAKARYFVTADAIMTH
jgi:IS5 family transposase